MVRLAGSVEDCPPITRHVEPSHIQRVHRDVVTVVLHLLQGVAGREVGQVDGVAGHHPHLPPVSEPQVLLEVLLMVEDGPDDHFPLQLQRDDLEGGEPMVVGDG